MFTRPRAERMPAMQATARQHEMLHTPDDADVAWARRRETIRGALKLFRVTLDAVRRHAEWSESRHGISAAQLWAVCELAQNPGMRAVDLARNMAVHRATADQLLDTLVERGLARRQLNGGGSSHHFATDEGLRIAEASPEHGQGVLKAALENLPDAPLEQLVASMRALSECMPFREDRAALQPMADLLSPRPEEMAVVKTLPTAGKNRRPPSPRAPR